MRRTKQTRRRVVSTYVSIKTLAAELEISMPTVHAWLREGILPPPDAGFPASSRRWRWAQVEEWLAGDHSADLLVSHRKQRGPQRGAPNAGLPAGELTIEQARDSLEPFEFPEGKFELPDGEA